MHSVVMEQVSSTHTILRFTQWHKLFHEEEEETVFGMGLRQHLFDVRKSIEHMCETLINQGVNDFPF